MADGRHLVATSGATFEIRFGYWEFALGLILHILYATKDAGGK